MNNIDPIAILEWAALVGAALWTIGLFGLAMGSRRAKYAFRGKGYLRPPSGKAWIRFLYYKHYDAFEDPWIRFYYKIARICLFGSVLIVVGAVIFIGLLLILFQAAQPTRAPVDYSS